MVLPDADWKNQSRQVLDWLAVSLAAVLVVVYAAEWWRAGGIVNAGLAGTLLVWGVVYFTRFWQPVLYLVVAVIVSAATAVWIWNGDWNRGAVRVAMLLNVGFVALTIYLFNAEEPGVQPRRRPE